MARRRVCRSSVVGGLVVVHVWGLSGRSLQPVMPRRPCRWALAPPSELT